MLLILICSSAHLCEGCDELSHMICLLWYLDISIFSTIAHSTEESPNTNVIMDISLKTWTLEENNLWEYTTSLIIMFSVSPDKSDYKSCIWCIKTIFKANLLTWTSLELNPLQKPSCLSYETDYKTWIRAPRACSFGRMVHLSHTWMRQSWTSPFPQQKTWAKNEQPVVNYCITSCRR